MGQQDYGAAQPIYDWTKKYVAGPILGLEKVINTIPNPSKSVDTTWHDQMVRKANASFAKEAAQSKSLNSPKVSSGVKKTTRIKQSSQKGTSKKVLVAKR